LTSDPKLKVSLKWGEGGVETDQIRVEGCGLPDGIDFPQVSNTTTLGTELELRYKWYFAAAKDLRQLIDLARDPIVRYIATKVGTLSEAQRITSELLNVSEADLKKCDAINIEQEARLPDDEISKVMEEGYFERRPKVAIDRGLMSSQAVEVLHKILPLVIDQTPTSAKDLIEESNTLLGTSRNCSSCMQFWQQLSDWTRKLELDPSDQATASATTTALGALADCVYNQKLISEEEYLRLQGICWRFYG